MAEPDRQGLRLVGPPPVLRRREPLCLVETLYSPPQEADRLGLGEGGHLDAVCRHVAMPVRLPSGDDDVSVRSAGRYEFPQIERVGGIVEYEKPAPLGVLEPFECGSYRPVSCAVRGCLPGIKPFGELAKSFSHAGLMLG